jgi:hypothetical protein
MPDRSSISVTSSDRRSVCANAVCSVAGSGWATPSTMFSSTARSAVIGVRNSCETFAISSRRCWSAASRSAAIMLNATANSPTSSRDVARTRVL